MSKGERSVIMIDLVSVPQGWTGEEWIRFAREERIVFYDSSTGGDIPTVQQVEGDEVMIVDRNSKEGKKLIHKINNREG